MLVGLGIAVAVLLLGGLVAVAVGGESVDDDTSVAFETTTTAAAADPAAPPPTTAPAPEISTVQVEPPPGFVSAPEVGRYRAGVLHINDVANFSDDPEESKRVLERFGYRAGYARLWVNRQTGESLILIIYDMRDDAAAADFNSGVGQEALAGATEFPVPQIPSAEGATLRLERAGTTLDLTFVSFPKRNRVVSVGRLGPKPIPHDVVIADAQRLYERA